MLSNNPQVFGYLLFNLDLTIQQESFHKTLPDLTKYVLITERNYIFSPFLNFPEALPKEIPITGISSSNERLKMSFYHILEFWAVKNGTNHSQTYYTFFFFLRNAPERMFLIKLQITTSSIILSYILQSK